MYVVQHYDCPEAIDENLERECVGKNYELK